MTTLRPRESRGQGAGIALIADEQGPATGTAGLLLHGCGQTQGFLVTSAPHPRLTAAIVGTRAQQGRALPLVST